MARMATVCVFVRNGFVDLGGNQLQEGRKVQLQGWTEDRKACSIGKVNFEIAGKYILGNRN
jgi:hypothetical protein